MVLTGLEDLYMLFVGRRMLRYFLLQSICIGIVSPLMLMCILGKGWQVSGQI
jgi:hypothetical protein